MTATSLYFHWFLNRVEYLLRFTNLTIAIGTGILAAYAVLQARATRRTITLQFRPRLIIRKVFLCEGSYISTVGEPDPHQWKVEFTVANVGGSRATIKRKGFEVSLFEKGLPARLSYSMQPPKEPISILAGQEKEFSTPLDKKIVDVFKALQRAKGPYLSAQAVGHMYLWGCVEYADDLKVVRNVALCRHYNTDTGRFIKAGGSDYEYRD